MTGAVILSLSLDGYPPLPNKRMHWAEKADENRTWRSAAFVKARDAWRQHDHADDFPLRKAVLQVVVIRPGGQGPDPDNALAAVKPVIDGLVDAGILVSDRRECVSYLTPQYEVGPVGLRIDVVMGSVA